MRLPVRAGTGLLTGIITSRASRRGAGQLGSTCMTLGTDGAGGYGYSDGAGYGSLDEYYVNGLFIKSIFCADPSGAFVKFGDLGETDFFGAVAIKLSFEGFGDMVYGWSFADLRYEATSPELYDYFVANNGSVRCLSLSGTQAPFDGGMFKNGGFENGISNWKLYPTNGSWSATPDATTAQNIPNTTGTHFYQDFSLEAGATYELSADQISGDGVVTYCVNTADSGVAIADGPHRFIGKSSPESLGVTMSIAGSTPAVVDNLRLTKVDMCVGFDLCLSIGKSDTTEMYGYAPNAPTPYGSMDPSDFMGIEIYNFNFNGTNGTCAVSMGDVGDDKLGTYDMFSTTISGYANNPVVFTWDVDQTRYKVVDLDLATYIKANLGRNIGLTAAPLANNTVTFEGKVVTYNGETVTYTEV